jgi:hypothetical protein
VLGAEDVEALRDGYGRQPGHTEVSEGGAGGHASILRPAWEI